MIKVKEIKIKKFFLNINIGKLKKNNNLQINNVIVF